MSAFLVTKQESTLLAPATYTKVDFNEVERMIATGELKVSCSLSELKKFNSIFSDAAYESTAFATSFLYVETDFKNTMTVYAQS